jgi:hypothetical protein
VIKVEALGEGRYRIGGTVVANVHDAGRCIRWACVIHAPTAHSLSDWPILYRADRGIVERLCQHGVGHPDPDQWPYWQATGRMFEQVHSCDGCCNT